jgi:hypothetical protein
MPRVAEVGSGVLVLRVVTAADVAALHAQAQMVPIITDLHAVLAPIGARFDLVYLAHVGALNFVIHMHHILAYF